VRYIVVLEERAGTEVIEAMRSQPRLREVERFDGTSIWELDGAP